MKYPYGNSHSISCILYLCILYLCILYLCILYLCILYLFDKPKFEAYQTVSRRTLIPVYAPDEKTPPQKRRR